MGKRRCRARPSKPQDKAPEIQLDSDEDMDNVEDPDPKSRSYIYDEIDEFHANREKILLGNVKFQKDDIDSDEEEIFSLKLSDDSEGDFDQFHISQQKDEMNSDLEDAEDNLPNVKAWGQYKSTYYNTDYVDKGHGGFNEAEIEMAEAEEKEARALQQRMAEQLDEQDFGLDLFKVEKKAPETKEQQKIEKDLSNLSKQEKFELLQRESPELLALLEDFKVKMREISDDIQPLVDFINTRKIPPRPVTEYLKSKHQLLLNYCTNVSFYVMLKARRISLTRHPIVNRLVSYRKMIKELESLKEILQNDIDLLYKSMNSESGDNDLDISPEIVKNRSKRQLKILKKPLLHAKKVSFAEGISESLENKQLIKKEKRKKGQMETADEKRALALYGLMKDGHKEIKRRKGDGKEEDGQALASSEEDDELIDTRSEVIEEDQVGGKRKINYQIAKNKGLTPYRKKESRNPRVKNKMKFKKAKIRRRGQVREARKELQRYGGEASGIKASSSRSIKLK